MNLQETARVLAWAAAFDRRKVGEMDIQAWHAAIGDLPVEDCLEGVTRWYRDRADWMMPSHLRDAVKLVRADRLRAERIRRAEERGLSPALEAAGRRFGDLPGEVQEQLRTAATRPTVPVFGPNGECEHPEQDREPRKHGWCCLKCGTHQITDVESREAELAALRAEWWNRPKSAVATALDAEDAVTARRAVLNGMAE